jgi:hypothetical protein
VGRSPGRGAAVPGNLVAYRGEVLSQGVDSLDVFHQTAPLEARIETALRDTRNPVDDGWSLMWRGQLRLDRGDVAAGLADLRVAMAAAPGRFPPDMLPAALVHALERAPAMAETVWPELLSLDPSPSLVDRGLRLAVDSLAVAENFREAWRACRHLIDRAAAVAAAADNEVLVPDGRDPHLMVRESRWIQSRVLDRPIGGPAWICSLNGSAVRGSRQRRGEIGSTRSKPRPRMAGRMRQPCDRWTCVGILP